MGEIQRGNMRGKRRERRRVEGGCAGGARQLVLGKIAIHVSGDLLGIAAYVP